MSTAWINPVPGATALGSAADRHRHLMGDALRAIRVFARAAFGVVVLGEYAEGARNAGR
jgi:hypothetical protein